MKYRSNIENSFLTVVLYFYFFPYTTDVCRKALLKTYRYSTIAIFMVNMKFRWNVLLLIKAYVPCWESAQRKTYARIILKSTFHHKHKHSRLTEAGMSPDSSYSFILLSHNHAFFQSMSLEIFCLHNLFWFISILLI